MVRDWSRRVRFSAILGCMEVKFSRHALDQLKIRSRITKPIILDALKKPDKSLQSFRGRLLYRKQYGKEVLEVVVIKEDNKLIVITQYFLES
jgi:hypothetical protein